MAAFATLAGPYPPDIQARMARRTALFYAVVILLVTWAGRPLLAVPVPASPEGGGWLRAAAGGDAAELESGAAQSRSWIRSVAVPLTFPISIGGATLAAVIAATGEKLTVARPLATSAVCLLMTAVVWLTLRSAIPLTRRISAGAMAALTTFSGLLCISFQVIAAGLRDLLPGLRSP